jgi:hypothetical protein
VKQTTLELQIVGLQWATLKLNRINEKNGMERCKKLSTERISVPYYP